MIFSPWQWLLMRQIEALGLPPPAEEYVFAAPRRWRFDLVYPGRGLAIEVSAGNWANGRHVRGKGYEQDCEKYSEAAVRGWRIIHVTGDMVADGRAAQLVERAFGRRVI